MLTPPKVVRMFAAIFLPFSLLPVYLYVTEIASQWVPWIVFWTCYLIIPFVAKWSYEARGFAMLFAAIVCSFSTQFFAPVVAKDGALAKHLVEQFGTLYMLIGGGVGGNFIAHGVIERERSRESRRV